MAAKPIERSTELNVLDEFNVEVKARVGSDSEFERRLQIARDLTGECGEHIHQRDVFFCSQEGRFKLRFLELPRRSHLIYYERADTSTAKLSKYNKTDVEDPAALEKILTKSNGVRGFVIKDRYLFMYGSVRIHLDKVHNLGNFIEFEARVPFSDSYTEGAAVAKKLMKEFDIEEKDLITGAYMDELLKIGNA